VSALLDKIKEVDTILQNPTSLLLISQPNTPHKSQIPGTREETQKIMNIMDTEGIVSLLLEDSAGTINQVKKEIKTHNWVHFACHAVQDQHEPLKSGVHLHDGQLQLCEMMQQKLPAASHAFLSACQTSAGDEELSDEVVHLAAGMLAAGYQGVVATMWSIKDQYAPQIAADFYSHLLEKASGVEGRKQLDVAESASALDHSIQNIRKKFGSDTEDSLLTWVPYVHYGV